MNTRTEPPRAAFGPDARFEIEAEARRLRALYIRAFFRRAFEAGPRRPSLSVWARTAP